MSDVPSVAESLVVNSFPNIVVVLVTIAPSGSLDFVKVSW